eukprot:Lithocolla_globosa_v1_NODE_644_length_3527_cov_40.597062.p1 type:complete len:120 gc:universal NODE_644_length_3527_cov_40.597062:1985-2344(+)
MLSFFDECANVVDKYTGRPLFSPGAIVGMDNCQFHHGQHLETPLRDFLKQQAVALVFQPKYSPDMNPAEYCFVKLKTLLKIDSEYTYEFPELAITDAISCISPADCRGFCKLTGYIPVA